MTKFYDHLLTNAQQLGRALMLPIAILPAAGLFLRLGQPDLLDIAFVSAAGGALFENLGLLFAIGVAVGFAKEGHGAAALAGVVCYFVTIFGAKSLIEVPTQLLSDVPESVIGLVQDQYKSTLLGRLSVPIGIVSGVIAGSIYNRFYTMKLPDYLAFFGGKRLVPILSALAGIGVAFLIGLGIEPLNKGVTQLSDLVMEADRIGLFVYGLLNRLLIVTGLHHILNNIAWFVIGEYQGVAGDLNRFFAGDPDAGSYMAGFFPIMMFGLPAACLAMYRQTPKGQRKLIGGMLGSMSLTSFLTGVTEPIEFTFMFLAPLLYLVHAILTGLSLVIMDLFNVKLGFGFSAGLIDYLINFSASTRPLLLLPIGLGFSVVYYFAFTVTMRLFKIPLVNVDKPNEEDERSPDNNSDNECETFIACLGGAENINTISACTTRLRLTVVDNNAIDESTLKKLGAKGFVRPTPGTLQIIVGPHAEILAGELRAFVNSISSSDNTKKEVSAETSSQSYSALIPASILPKILRDALGGEENIVETLLLAQKRLSISLKAPVTFEARDLSDNGIFVVSNNANSQTNVDLLISNAKILGSLPPKTA